MQYHSVQFEQPGNEEYPNLVQSYLSEKEILAEIPEEIQKEVISSPSIIPEFPPQEKLIPDSKPIIIENPLTPSKLEPQVIEILEEDQVI